MKKRLNNNRSGWKISKRRRRAKRVQKQRNIRREKRKTISYEKETRNKFTKKIERITISAGSSLSLFENPENVISLIDRLDRHTKSSKSLTNIQVDLSEITKIDIAAISLLLAKVHQLSKFRRIKIWGNMPNNKACENVLYESGFLDYMTDLSGEKFKKQSDNFFFKVGSDKTRNERVGKAIETAIGFLAGQPMKFPPAYSIVQEICSNSVEWANPDSNHTKNWFMGVQLVSGSVPYINFTMTDIGFGILRTLDRKFHKIIVEALLKDETEILYRAFERKYGSKTREANRNRGLPLIKDRFEKHFIEELVVITNNVLLNFFDGSQTRVLKKNLPGTFYSWKINLNCLEEWKKQQLSQ